MNQTNVRVRYLDLEAANADADTVSALVGIVSQVQSGKALPAIQSASVEAFIDTRTPPLALPAPKKARKPRALKAAKTESAPAAKSARVNDAGPQLLAALRKNPRPDRIKLAKAIYGDESKSMKISQLLSYLCGNGKLTNNGDGTYAVNG